MSDQQPDNAVGRPVHGGLKPRELRDLGLNPEDLVDFSASISPIGPPEGVWEAIRSVDLSAYPDPECLDLREAICRHISTPSRQIPIERVLVGNGSTEIFHLLTRVYLSPANSAVLLTPTYGEYDGACRLSGATVFNLEADLTGGFRWDMEAAAILIAAERPKLVIVCNPNNPTGVYLDLGEIEALAKAADDAGSLLVVDEAYLAFVADPWDSLALLHRPNVMLVRSMTKDYAQTALRLGYALASEDVVARLRAYQPDWSVNGLAQKAGISALEDAGYLPRAREAVFSAKAYLTAEFQALGLEVPQSDANFLLVRVGNAATWRASLLAKGVVVRDCASFGLPEYIRVGVRAMADCRVLAAAVADVARSAGLGALDDSKPGD
ncbi:MAG: histidinol-phosphate transaminase [Chloroflexi bacterium]|nr:histidinol-phosphate transaminase [Chloroflexota bacterium]MDA1270176.1 histidinol-phosphate transaminase [Chloroflexota bacterium]